MLYEELSQRYGTQVALRIRSTLSASEFTILTLDELAAYLTMFAELAEKEYIRRIDNPFINEELGSARDEYMRTLHQRWCEAEELAYLVLAAEGSDTLKQRQASA